MQYNSEHVIIDRTLSNMRADYARLPISEREDLIWYAENVLAPESPQYLGDFGISAAIAIISLITVAITAAGGIAKAVIEAKKSKQAAKIQAATDAVRKNILSINAESEAMVQETGKQTSLVKTAAFGVLGLGVIVGITALL